MEILPASFRDPSGFLFIHDGALYRQINKSYQDDYDLLISSGLYESLAGSGLLVSHEDADIEPVTADGCKVIRPVKIPFISYPYEWCFSQLKDAALLTLEVQKRAFEYGMSLKDASAYNVQFLDGRPVFIDTLSFEKYEEGQTWPAYRQFCQHFLAPLALMSYKDVRLAQLFRVYIDGPPLDLVSRLLPLRSYFRPSLLSHLHVHASTQGHFADKPVKPRGSRMSRMGFMGLIDSLESAVKSLVWLPRGTEWAEYYDKTNYVPDAFEQKKSLVSGFIGRAKPASVWDLGANTGVFSRLAADRGISTVSFDIDPAAVEKNYLKSRSGEEGSILPLVLDLANPSPGIGWENEERPSLIRRGPADMALALALIHHLSISNNLPFRMAASFMSRICDWLVIEFVPKDDSQVERLLASRKDIFPYYARKTFEKEFSEFFSIMDAVDLKGSRRTLYLMRRNRPTS